MTDKRELLLAQARTVALEDLPRLLGDIEEARAVALSRLMSPPPKCGKDELIDVAEAAARMGVSRDYLYRNHKRLPFARRVGRKLLFSAVGLDVYLKRSR